MFDEVVVAVGVNIDKITAKDALLKAEGFANSEGVSVIYTPNPEIVMAAYEDEEFMNVLNSSDMCVPDGIGVVYGAKMIGNPLPERVAGFDLSKGLIEKLSKTANREILCYADLKAVLVERLDFFCGMGCCAADHGMETVLYIPAQETEIDKIFKNVLKGNSISAEDAEKYKTALLLFLAEEYSKRNIVMQLHMGVIRNNNTRMFKLLGADSGHDSVSDTFCVKKLSQFMDNLEQRGVLPKTILYSLNGKDNITLATLMGCFQGEGVPGKIQLGSAWWFLDNIDGMEAQIKCLANEGSLATFVGMLTDSRSLLSYPRHEYFRRILCNIIGGWVEDEMFTNDEKILKTLIQNICTHNAEKFFM